MQWEASIPKQMNPLILKYEYTILDVTPKRRKVDKSQNVLLMPFHRVKKKSLKQMYIYEWINKLSYFLLWNKAINKISQYTYLRPLTHFSVGTGYIIKYSF